MENTQQENKMFWVDNLRAFASIAVIFLHVAAIPVSQYGSVSSLSWWAGNVYDSTVRFCVPVFVMLTGALLLPQNYPLDNFLRKRLVRVVIPFIFWSFIYTIFSLSLKFMHGDRMTLSEIIKYFFVSFQKGSSFHLWYVYMIIGLYLFIPVISKWVRNSNEKELLYFLLIWLCTLLLSLPVISIYKTEIDLSHFSGYIGYLVLGYYLTIKKFKNQKKTTFVATTLVVAGILITIIGTYFETRHYGKFTGLLYINFTPNVLMASIGVFLLFKNKNTTNQKLKNFTHFISRYSYGIYLIHIIVLSFLIKAGISWYLINPVIGIPLTAFTCLAGSGGVIYAMNRLPYGKYISG